MQITITGTPGSGKTTLAKAIAKKLKMEFFSVGEIRRQIASSFGLSIDELNKIGEKENFTDVFVDKMIKNILGKRKNIIIDGRLAWWLFPKSTKILLVCDLDVAARRIAKAKRKSEKKYKNIEEVKEEIKKRIESDEKRYFKYYKIKNIYDIKHYDIIIDTTYLNIDNMIKIALKFLKPFTKCIK